MHLRVDFRICSEIILPTLQVYQNLVPGVAVFDQPLKCAVDDRRQLLLMTGVQGVQVTINLGIYSI